MSLQRKAKAALGRLRRKRKRRPGPGAGRAAKGGRGRDLEDEAIDHPVRAVVDGAHLVDASHDEDDEEPVDSSANFGTVEDPRLRLDEDFEIPAGFDLLDIAEKAGLVGKVGAGSSGGDACGVDSASCLPPHTERFASALAF